MKLTLQLPLPPRSLSSNDGRDHRYKARDVAQARWDGQLATRMAGDAAGWPRAPWDWPTKWRLSLVFGTKGSRAQGRYAPRDESNALASFKAYQDGIFDGLGLDDSAKHCEVGTVRIDPKLPAGVSVTLEALE